jgi:ATP/maltotriose-dependent transcriptional regulator MalT/DNA-binding SARP family transcriptional activator
VASAVTTGPATEVISAATLVIQQKLEVPPLSETRVARPRVESRLAELIENHRVVAVLATAGAGKTTAVAAAAELMDRPVAWLTLDTPDAAQGRLLTYLEASLARVAPQVSGVVAQALSAGLGHVEAAGLLADALGDQRVVLVLDDMERLGEEREPWELIDSLLRHGQNSLRAVLISRRDVPHGLSALRPSTGAMAALGDGDLTFTAGEAADALAEIGKGEADAASAVEATGGWVTGVLFEAWRSAEHVPGMGGEADPLHGYLSAQMLAELPPEDRDFLIETAILHDVSPARAAALGRADGGERLASLRAAHLPVAWGDGRMMMRCHPRFHEYLLALLERRPPESVRALRLAHGRLLADEGLHEEATEELLRADALEPAFSSARRAIFAVIERVDYSTAERWIATLEPVVPGNAHDWVEAELLLGFTKLEYARSERISDRLLERGEREAVAATSERAAALMGWNYLDAARIDDFKAVLAVAPEGPALAAVKYRAWLTYNVAPGQKPVAPPRTGGPFDSAILIGDYLLGRLRDLPESEGSAWALGVATPWRIAMLRARGQTQRAIELYEEAMHSLSVPHSRMLSIFIGPELLVDAGRGDEARAAIAEGRRIAQADGSLSPIVLNSFADAKLALRLEKDPVLARAVLDHAESASNARRIAWAAETFDTLYGLALLLQRHDEPALARLRSAVAGMQEGDRILELPTAAVYLAEAEWRAGNEDAADRAADIALVAARRQGSNHILMQALADLPAVLSRRIDGEPSADSIWHQLGRALIADGVRLTANPGASVRFGDFGERSLEVDGEPRPPKISKSYELLAFLLTYGEATREELLGALFKGRADNSSRAYLRQAINGLRECLPERALVAPQGGSVALADDVLIVSDSERLESRLIEAARLQGRDRVAATLDALTLSEQGRYLEGASSPWIDDRRARLSERVLDARLDTAELALAAGDLELAQRLGREVLEADPYREAAWRLVMHIAGLLGDPDGVIREYKACEQALARIGATPAGSTRKLLEQLRL